MTERRFIELREFDRLGRKAQEPRDAIVRFTANPEMKAINDEARSIDFLISDKSRDRDNDTIDPAGWKLDAYLRNSVVLWAHDPTQPPVAKAPETRIGDGALISTAIFAPADLNPFADMIFRMYKGGFMHAVSVGFKPIDYEFRGGSEENDFGCDFVEQELLEYSCVPVPSNANALMRAKAAGISTAPLIAWLEKALDGEGKLLIPRDVAERLRKAAGGKSPSVHHLSRRTEDELRADNLARAALQTAKPNASNADHGMWFLCSATPVFVWAWDGKAWFKREVRIGMEVAALVGKDGHLIDFSEPSIIAGITEKGVTLRAKESPAVEKKPLLVKRPVLNPEDVHKWMKENGYKTAVKPGDMHVKVMLSKKPVDHATLPTPDDQPMTVKVERGLPSAYGTKSGHALPAEHPDLHERHKLYKEAGAEQDGEFKPHVRITHAKDGMPENVEAYSGELKLGPETCSMPSEEDFTGDSPDDELDLSGLDEYGQDPGAAEAGNAPKWVLDLIAKGIPVTIERVGEVSVIKINAVNKAPEWKCGAASDLPVDTESTWDGPAAAKSVFDACGFDGDKPDAAKAAKAFLANDADKPTEKGSYKLPIAHMKDGKMTVVKAGVDAASSRLSGTDIPDSVKESAQKVIDHYKAKWDGKVSQDMVRKAVAEALAEAGIAPAEGVTIKMDDGTTLSDPEKIATFIGGAVGKAVDDTLGKMQGRV